MERCFYCLDKIDLSSSRSCDCEKSIGLKSMDMVGAEAAGASVVAEPCLLRSFRGIALVMSKPTGILSDLGYDSCQ